MERLLFLVLCINIVAIFLGWLLTQNKRWTLSRLSSFFDRKPFNCRPCLTFHLLWAMYTLVALATSSIQFGIAGLILSLVVFAGLYFDGKSKIDD